MRRPSIRATNRPQSWMRVPCSPANVAPTYLQQPRRTMTPQGTRVSKGGPHGQGDQLRLRVRRPRRDGRGAARRRRRPHPLGPSRPRREDLERRPARYGGGGVSVTTETQPLDEAKVEEFLGKAVGDFSSAMTVLVASLA